jgi:hypothetical protein
MSQKFLDLGAEVYVDKAQAAKEAKKALQGGRDSLLPHPEA